MHAVRPLADITAAVEGNPALRKAIGREAMWFSCAGCALATCKPSSGGCKARQLFRERQRAYYLRVREVKKQRARDYYARNREQALERKRLYRIELGREVENVKRRARYAGQRLAAGVVVKPRASPTRTWSRKAA